MNKDKEPVPLSHRFSEALVFAAMLHRKQFRKGTTIPYISHPMAVASLVLENGGSEDAAIGALLHDAAEDCGGHETLKRIRHTFGDRVAEIVEGCTDTFEDPKPEWRRRKEVYIKHLPDASAETRLVSLADKVHNARAILYDLRTHGPSVWGRFKKMPGETLWYYRTLATTFLLTGPVPLAKELDRVVSTIEREFGTVPSAGKE